MTQPASHQIGTRTQPDSSYQVPPHPSGLDMRTQLNLIIQCLLTDNAGPSEPVEMYPGMYWGDTTAARLRRRNNTNDAWIDIGPLDDFLADVRYEASHATPPGTIIMWWGDIAKIPAGWVLCDGTNGTPNMFDRMPIGAGSSYAPGAIGGRTAVALSINELPHHAHAMWDNGHGHGFSDPGHAHGVSDSAHMHGMPDGGVAQAGADNGGATAASGPNGYGQRGAQGSHWSNANIGIYGSGTGCWIDASGVGVGIYGEGGGAAFDIRPPYLAMYFLMKL